MGFKPFWKAILEGCFDAAPFVFPVTGCFWISLFRVQCFFALLPPTACARTERDFGHSSFHVTGLGSVLEMGAG